MNEVVLGVQFANPKGYQQIFAGKVWDLYKAQFPDVQEQSPLVPVFETFGIPHRRPIPQFQIEQGTLHDRYWFLNSAGDELIQFQQDRLLHNWRKVGDGSNAYPRFETMALRFKEELESLQGFFASLQPQALHVNQCEISYINHIACGSSAECVPFLKFLNFGNLIPDDFSMTFREINKDASGSPVSRLVCEAATSILPTGQEAVVLTLTVRGAPQTESIESALDFLANGREIIVKRFTELTTDVAHRKWRRVK